MRDPIDFDVAVQMIFDRVSEHKAAYSPWLCHDCTDDNSVYRQIATLKGHWALDRERKRLFEDANADPAAYDMLKFAIAEKIKLDLGLEEDESAWIADELLGLHSPPSHKSRAYTKHPDVRRLGLHMLAADCVYLLVMRGMKATRNNASPPMSASNAVAEAFARHGLDVQTYDGVIRCLKHYKPQHSPRPKTVGK